MTHVVYLYSDPLTHTPRYVGKASDIFKMERHIRYGSHNPKLQQMIDAARAKGVDVKPTVLCGGLTNNKQASAIERFWIATIGRGDKKRGPLFNGTDGGDGVVGRSGFKMPPRDAQWRQKQSDAQKGPRSQEFKDKMSVAMQGINKGRKHTKIMCPHCGKEGGNTIMKRWHFDNCKEKPNG